MMLTSKDAPGQNCATKSGGQTQQLRTFQSYGASISMRVKAKLNPNSTEIPANDSGNK